MSQPEGRAVTQREADVPVLGRFSLSGKVALITLAVDGGMSGHGVIGAGGG